MTDDPKQELVQSWLIKALHDLGSAKKLAADPNPFFDAAIYHCQQSAEKAVKGFLLFHDTRFDKTHNIVALINLALSHEPNFAKWLPQAELLTPYATEFRYPGITSEPTIEQVKTAIKAADDLYKFVISILPPSTHPNK